MENNTPKMNESLYPSFSIIAPLGIPNMKNVMD